MSIVVAHGYSMMYAKQKQGTADGPLSLNVTPLPFKAATYGKIAPSSKAELDQYNSENDFYTGLITPEGDPEVPWDDAWPITCWTKVGGRYYTWDGDGPSSDGWITAPLTSGSIIDAATAGIDTPANELLFVGRYPQTKKELDTRTPKIEDGDGGEITSPYFATNKYVRLIGQGVGDQYFWTGTEWRPGVSDD